ncbi:MAG: hypothetical protein HC845_08910 [Akkermansiaceae bacterium]|nr:hypothetical protein [Akkermansiaceae bacterium]
MPEKESADALASRAASLAYSESYAVVTEYLDRIQATPAERAASVEQSAERKMYYLSSKRKVIREDIDAMREWANAQSPETTDQATGKALAAATQSGKKLEFSEAVALATHYHDAAGNDEVLVSFLSAAGYTDKEQARSLVEKIADPEKREKLLEKWK